MFQILFCVVFLFSAWATWRANPMYSARSTIRTLLIMLLVIAAAVLLIIGAVQISMRHSATFTYVTMAIVIIFDVWMMTFVLTVFTTPASARPAALPHGTVLVHANRTTALKWTRILGIFIVVLFLIGLVLPEEGQIILFTLAGFTAFISVILMPVLYWTERNTDISQTAVALSPWVHWSYTPAQWATWADVQRDRLGANPPTITLRKTGPKLLLMIAAVAAGVYAFCPGSWLWKTLYIVAITAFLVLIMVWSAHGERHAGETLHRKLMHAPPDVYFGSDGLLADGGFTPWLNPSTWLVSAARDDRAPRSLLFHFERQVPNPYGGPDRIEIYHSILLPEHSEADVARLAEELTARCPSATIALS
jgi:hypothetical protein